MSSASRSGKEQIKDIPCKKWNPETHEPGFQESRRFGNVRLFVETDAKQKSGNQKEERDGEARETHIDQCPVSPCFATGKKKDVRDMPQNHQSNS